MEFNKPMKFSELAEIMGEEPGNGGSNRNLQLARWRQYYVIEAVKEENGKDSGKRYNKYIIKRERTEDERFDDLDELNKMRKTNFLVPEELKNSAGIYKIQKDMFIYIGQTKNFGDRFGRHRTNKGQTYKLMKSGGKFEILELIDDEKERLKKETEYIKYFSSSSDYICLNKAENVNYKGNGRKREFSKIKFPVVFENEVIEFLKEKGINYERI